MHLAAAVETKSRMPTKRPCVVIAGGREPAHWEAYPDHQFIHTNGALSCCANGGCWKDRVVPLRDGNKRDRPGYLCVDVANGIPRCLDMITPAEVGRRIETYFRGGVIDYLRPQELKVAGRAVCATARNEYDKQPLNLHEAGLACEHFISSLPAYPDSFRGRGIVICAGGVNYFTGAWVCINLLRQFGCRLPVELWHLNGSEMDEEMRALMKPLGVSCIDASKMRRKHPARALGGWELKAYAIAYSSFREILFLDADNVPVADPGYLFDHPEFQRTGAIFWQDYGSGISSKALPIWKSCGLRRPAEREFETGQIVLDKKRCWRALRLCLWFNENSDFYYQYLYGDKETFHLAFRKLKQPYSLVPHPIHSLEKTMCQHDFDGRRIFQHRNQDKWDLFLGNERIKDFWFEQDCFDYVARLQKLWSGRCGKALKLKLARAGRRAKSVRIEAVMLSQTEREGFRKKTLANLAGTDWTNLPLHVQIEDGEGGDFQEKQTHRAYLGLKESLKRRADYVFLLDDAMEFNRHLRHNLLNWAPFRSGNVTLAGLHNAKTKDLACDIKNHTRVVDPNSVHGGRAFLISRDTVEYLVRNWNNVEGTHDLRIPRLAGRRKHPVFYHAPSLVKPIAGADAQDDTYLRAGDYDPYWAA
jgi:hypothetical protein